MRRLLPHAFTSQQGSSASLATGRTDETNPATSVHETAPTRLDPHHRSTASQESIERSETVANQPHHGSPQSPSPTTPAVQPVLRLFHSSSTAISPGPSGSGPAPSTQNTHSSHARQFSADTNFVRSLSGKLTPFRTSPPASPRKSTATPGNANSSTNPFASPTDDVDPPATFPGGGLLKRISSHASATLARAASATHGLHTHPTAASTAADAVTAGFADPTGHPLSDQTAARSSQSPVTLLSAASTTDNAHRQSPISSEVTPSLKAAHDEVAATISALLGPTRSAKSTVAETVDFKGGRASIHAEPANTASASSSSQSKISSTFQDDVLVQAFCSSEESRSALVDQFLRARHGSAAETTKMIRDTLAWRKSVNIGNYMTNYSQMLNHPNAHFPMRVLTDPQKGHKQAVVYALLRLLDKRRIERVPFINAVIAFFEDLYFRQVYPVEPVNVIIDLRGWSIRRNSPYRVVREGLEILQDYYPDRLGRVFLLNYPSTVRAAYAVISPIIDPGAREKVVWVPENPQDVLAKHLPPSSIPVFLGGELDVNFPGVDLAAEWNDPTLVESSYF